MESGLGKVSSGLLYFLVLCSASSASPSYFPKLTLRQLKTSPKMTAGKGGIKSAPLLETLSW